MVLNGARPGSGIGNVKDPEMFVTLGAYVLTDDKHLCLLSTAHGLVYLSKGTGAKGDLIRKVRFSCKTQPAGNLVTTGRGSSNLRILGIGEDLPAVLKAPVEAEVGVNVVKSGARTGVTYGRIISTDSEIMVKFSNGQTAKFAAQIKTTQMGEAGDSGSLLLTTDGFDPLGILASTTTKSTYFSKLTNVVKALKLLGVFCPLSVPSHTPLFLKQLANLLIRDGCYLQRNNILAKRLSEVFKDLGIECIEESLRVPGFILWSDLFIVSMPFVEGDLGEIVTNCDNYAVGIIVGGNENSCICIPIKNLLKAFALEIF